MNTKERREDIKKLLNRSNSPLKGIEIANRYGVSRQVIVQDMAILRAEGIDIVSTSRGYVILKPKNSKIVKTIATKHGHSDMRDEMEIILRNGGKILNVIVEHSVYGELIGNINIGTEEELDAFMTLMGNRMNEPLSFLTDGLHLHTVEVESIEDYNNIIKGLEEAGYLVE